MAMAKPLSTSQAAMVERMDDEETKKKKKQKKAKAGIGSKASANAATGAASGAVAGATAGSVVPGIGTAIGAVVGAVAGGVMGNQEEKSAAEAARGPRPERRRMTAAAEQVKGRKDKKLRAMATLSEAVFNWAQSSRR